MKVPLKLKISNNSTTEYMKEKESQYVGKTSLFHWSLWPCSPQLRNGDECLALGEAIKGDTYGQWNSIQLSKYPVIHGKVDGTGSPYFSEISQAETNKYLVILLTGRIPKG